MEEKAESRPTDAAAPPAENLVCWKVWGGNGKAEVALSIPGLRGHLYSQPCDSERGGDLYYLSACGSGALARLCVADVTGHGESVATFSGWLEEVFSKHIHRASPSGVLREVNRRATARGLELMSTAVCLSYNSLNGQLSFCNAGHPPIRLCRRGETTWQPVTVNDAGERRLFNLPLAVDAEVRYTLGTLRLHPGDRLLVHTDGLTEARDSAGRQLGESLWDRGQLPGSEAPVPAIMEAIQAAVAAHTTGQPDPDDDLTVLVLEVQPYQNSNRYALFLKNNYDRLARSMLRAFRGH